METTRMEINAKDVMKLRQKTGLGMMDCKKALMETGGDMAKAEEWLRQTMKDKMDTRADRPAGQGAIAVAIRGDRAAIVEVRAETDFTARNELFRKMADEVAGLASAAKAGAVAASSDITSLVDNVRITTGENVSFARGESLEGGSFGKYVHHDGKLGVLIQIEGSAPDELLTGISQHIAAHVPTPIAVDEAGVPRELIESRKAEAVREAQESGKPPEIAEKIATGKMRKFFEEQTLLGQKYIKDPDGKKQVKDVLPQGVKVRRFLRYVVGGE